MVTKDRRLLEQLIKQWAQDHTFDYEVADYTPSQEALESTQGHFTWLIQQGNVHIDLIGLADRIELFLINRRRRRGPDGLICQKCKDFFEFAEPNQEDGSLICYSCRKDPYR